LQALEKCVNGAVAIALNIFIFVFHKTAARTVTRVSGPFFPSTDFSSISYFPNFKGHAPTDSFLQTGGKHRPAIVPARSYRGGLHDLPELGCMSFGSLNPK